MIQKWKHKEIMIDQKTIKNWNNMFIKTNITNDIQNKKQHFKEQQQVNNKQNTNKMISISKLTKTKWNNKYTKKIYEKIEIIFKNDLKTEILETKKTNKY